jgi:putative aldouronate transport system permease protein
VEPVYDVKPKKESYKTFWKKGWDQRYLYAMSIPFIIWLVIFQYLPIWGWTMAFQKYKFGKSFFDQKWVGLKNFTDLINDDRFWLAFRNTIGMSTMGLVAGFVLPIVFALFLNEIRGVFFKRSIQTISYLPHFVSWVVVANIFIKLLSTDGGTVNRILVSLGILNEPVQFMAQPKLFWWIITIATAWKETGWQSIIYLASMAGIDQEIYEAATVDGCGRFKKMWYITLPGISTTIVILFIMAFGALTQIGFERQMLMGNAIVTDYSEVIDLYALKYGIGIARYSFGTAVGVFNSLIAIILLVVGNTVSKKTRGESVF